MQKKYTLDTGDDSMTPETIKKYKGTVFDTLEDALVWISLRISNGRLEPLTVKLSDMSCAMSRIYIYKDGAHEGRAIASLIREIRL